MSDYLADTNVGNIKYISKQDAVDAVPKERIVEYMDEFGAGYNSCRNDILRSIESIEPADVAPVVRCENCIHWSDSNQCARPELSGSRWHDPKYFDTYPDDFCSYGERKEKYEID